MAAAAPAPSPQQVLTDAIAALDRAAAPSPRQKLAVLDQICAVRAQVDQQPLEAFCNVSLLANRLRPLLADPIQTIRAAALRTARTLCGSPSWIATMLAAKMHVFVIRSLERDAKHKLERLQAVKLVRKMIEVEPMLFPRSLVSSLVAVAEHADDHFSRVCLESLCELAVVNTAIATLGGGLRTIALSVLERRFDDIIEPLMLTLVHLFSAPRSRVYLDHAHELGAIMTCFTDTYTAGETDVERRREAARRAILAALRTWPGLIFIGSLQALGIGAIVSALAIDDAKIQNSLLLTLYSLFRIRPPRSTTSFLAALRSHSENLAGRESELSAASDAFNLADSYMAIVLVAFVYKGRLLEALVELGCSESREVAVLVTILLGELLHMANRILPAALCAQLQSLPSLVASAAAFVNRDDRGIRSRANTLLSNLHEFGRMRKLASEYTDFHLQILLQNTYRTRRALGRDNAGRTLNDHIKNLKVRMEARMDESKLQALLRATEVNNGKDYTKWHWDLIVDVIEGPLSDPRRMEECFAKTKFAKRILSFLRPTNRQFADIKIDRRNKHKNLRFIRTACLLLETLMASDEGARYVAENPFLGQITDFCREELASADAAAAAAESQTATVNAALAATAVATSGSVASAAASLANDEVLSDRFLDRARLLKTMSREYFTMLGVLSATRRGQELLEAKDLFNVLYPLSEGKTGREDIAKLIVTSLDYNLDGHPRILLAKAMTCKNKKIRLIATRHMRVLMRAGVNDFLKWGSDLLVTQLSDGDKDIAQTALKILVEACEGAETLASLISKQPLLATLDGRGKDLLIKFLSLPEGFAYLARHNWIAPELESWHLKGNLDYVNALEMAIARSLEACLFPTTDSAIPDDASATTLRPHFYGELAKTAEGCALLAQSKHFDDFVRQLNDESVHVMFRKAAMWAIAHVGSSALGWEFVERAGVMGMLVALAEGEGLLTLKGAAYFALGLLSQCEKAAAVLKAAGWETLGGKGICVPREAHRFFHVADYAVVAQWASSGIGLDDPAPATPATPTAAAPAPAPSAGMAGVLPPRPTAGAVPASVPKSMPKPAVAPTPSAGVSGALPRPAGAGGVPASLPKSMPKALPKPTPAPTPAPAAAAAAAAPAAAPAAAATTGTGGDDDLEVGVPGKIADAVGKLSSHITADAAARELKRIKRDESITHFYSAPEVVTNMLVALQNYKFRQPARRFIWDLFESAPLHSDEICAAIDRCRGLEPVSSASIK